VIVNLAKFRLISSVNRPSSADPPVATEVIKTSSKFSRTYRTGEGPPLRQVQNRIGKVAAGTAGLKQRGRRAIEPLRDREIPHFDPARSATLPDVRGAWMRRCKLPGQHVDLAREVAVRAFARYAWDLQETIGRYG
jgi:hypothetical protein